MPKNPLKHKFYVNIYGEKWKIFHTTKSQFVAMFGNDCEAITHYHHGVKNPKREIYFYGKRVSLDTIRHELVHAYLSYHYYTRISKHDLEELFCEMIGKINTSLERIARSIKGKLDA